MTTASTAPVGQRLLFDDTILVAAEAGRLRDAIAANIIANTTADRSDRLWPAHYLAFSTNPLSVAYGASGIAAFLHRSAGGLDPNARRWLLNHDLSAASYPPGLWVGLAGIALTFIELDELDRAEAAMQEAYRSALLFADPTMFFGVAGWGLASLRLLEATNRERYADMSQRAADWLLTHASASPEGLCWVDTQSGVVNFGYGHGSSGIAWFLAEAGRVLCRDDLSDAARRAIGFDVAHAIPSPMGIMWKDYERGIRRLSFWGHGSAGVGMVAARLYRPLGDDTLLDVAEQCAQSVSVRWAASPAQVNGLSGMGDFLVDMYRLTGDSRYLARAQVILRAIATFLIETSEGGLAVPGRWMTRASSDFATGAAGVGLFLHRLCTMEEKLFVDAREAQSARSMRTASSR